MKTDPQDQDSELLTREVNRLYWESDTSVNQIGEELGLSKGALYGMLAPLPAGLPCIKCGDEMSYPNRTAREKGFVACTACGYEELEEVVQEHWQDAADLEAAGVPVEAPTALATPSESELAKEDYRALEHSEGGRRFGARALAGTALLGVATGIFIGSVLRKR
jgi:hypothetical protein